MAFVLTADSDEGLSRTRQVAYILIIVLFSIMIYLFTVRGMRTFLVPSRSMEPTLMTNDYLMTFTQKTYSRGDVVVLIDPEDPKAYIVKRIVAVGGDTVAVESRALLLNGVYASEPYISEPMQYDMPSLKVPDGEVLVLGDNRNLSDDASRWEKKTLSVKSIVGRVHYIFLPLSRKQVVRRYPLVNADGK